MKKLTLNEAINIHYLDYYTYNQLTPQAHQLLILITEQNQKKYEILKTKPAYIAYRCYHKPVSTDTIDSLIKQLLKLGLAMIRETSKNSDHAELIAIHPDPTTDTQQQLDLYESYKHRPITESTDIINKLIIEEFAGNQPASLKEQLRNIVNLRIDQGYTLAEIRKPLLAHRQEYKLKNQSTDTADYIRVLQPHHIFIKYLTTSTPPTTLST